MKNYLRSLLGILMIITAIPAGLLLAYICTLLPELENSSRLPNLAGFITMLCFIGYGAFLVIPKAAWDNL